MKKVIKSIKTRKNDKKTSKNDEKRRKKWGGQKVKPLKVNRIYGQVCLDREG